MVQVENEWGKCDESRRWNKLLDGLNSEYGPSRSFEDELQRKNINEADTKDNIRRCRHEVQPSSTASEEWKIQRLQRLLLLHLNNIKKVQYPYRCRPLQRTKALYNSNNPEIVTRLNARSLKHPLSYSVTVRDRKNTEKNEDDPRKTILEVGDPEFSDECQRDLANKLDGLLKAALNEKQKKTLLKSPTRAVVDHIIKNDRNGLNIRLLLKILPETRKRPWSSSGSESMAFLIRALMKPKRLNPETFNGSPPYEKSSNTADHDTDNLITLIKTLLKDKKTDLDRRQNLPNTPQSTYDSATLAVLMTALGLLKTRRTDVESLQKNGLSHQALKKVIYESNALSLLAKPLRFDKGENAFPDVLKKPSENAYTVLQAILLYRIKKNFLETFQRVINDKTLGTNEYNSNTLEYLLKLLTALKEKAADTRNIPQDLLFRILQSPNLRNIPLPARQNLLNDNVKSTVISKYLKDSIYESNILPAIAKILLESKLTKMKPETLGKADTFDQLQALALLNLLSQNGALKDTSRKDSKTGTPNQPGVFVSFAALLQLFAKVLQNPDSNTGNQQISATPLQPAMYSSFGAPYPAGLQSPTMYPARNVQTPTVYPTKDMQSPIAYPAKNAYPIDIMPSSTPLVGKTIPQKTPMPKASLQSSTTISNSGNLEANGFYPNFFWQTGTNTIAIGKLHSFTSILCL
uniref:ANK_REP_REGION domain-containing protein n=1 Tax=Syphacia muris TaxID=451379 RepID=A0A0N5AJ17_9BILA